MKKLGIIGGTSWNSTHLYYEHINRQVARRLGGLHSARLVLESLDLAPYAALQMAGKTEEAEQIIRGAGLALVSAGAEAILIASNTTNRYASAVERATQLPVLPIAQPTIDAIKANGHQRVAILGTRFTMTEEFGRAPYEDAGLEVMQLSNDWIATIDRIIFDELAKGIVRRESQRAFKTLLTELVRQKADAVVLGCTELVLAVDSRANVLPVFDTTELHAGSAVDWMLSDEEGAREAA